MINQDVEALRSQVAKRDREMEVLQLKLQSRQEAVEEVERELARLQEEMERVRQETTQQLADHTIRADQALASLDAEVRKGALLEGTVRKQAEMIDQERAHFTATLSQLEQQVRETEERATAREEECQKRVEEVESTLKEIQGERDGFERKLKRHKLFADVLGSMEHTIHQLDKAVHVPVAEDASSREKVLRQQVTDLSLSLKQLNATIHKTKKLVAFGDQKNDQLHNEVLSRQKQANEQKLLFEREQKTSETLRNELEEARAEIARLREANQTLERSAQALSEEAHGLKTELAEMMGTEDSFQARWRRESNESEKLRERVSQLKSEVASLKKDVKNERTHFERRLVATRSEEDRELLDIMQEEMNRYKAELLCSLCKKRPKSCYLSSCSHVLCRQCVEERIAVCC